MFKEKEYNRIRIGFATAAFCIGFFVVLTYLNMQQSLRESNNVRTALENLLHLENIFTEVQAVETGQRGFMLTGDQKFLSRHNAGLQNIRDNIAFLDNVKVNDREQSKQREILKVLISEKINFSKQAIEVRKNYGLDSGIRLIRAGVGESLMNQVKVKIHVLEEINRKLLNYSNLKSEKAAKATAWQFLSLAIFFYIVLYFNYKVIMNDFRKTQLADKKLKYNASLINSISDPIITADKDLNVISWNKYAEELYGWNESEVIGMPVKDILRSSNTGSDYNNKLSEFKQKGIWKGETTHRHKDGHIIHVLTTTSEIKNDEGEFVGGVTIMRDITGLKHIENRLHQLTGSLEKEVQEKVAELNNVFERITDAFIALDNNWCYTYVNKKAADMHGCCAEDLIGKNIWDIYPDVVNEDFYTAMHKAYATMKPLGLELYYSKTKQWFEDLIYPSPDGISVYYRDITEKKKVEIELQNAESKFRSLVEESPVGVYIVQNEKIIYVNPRFAEIFGYKPEYILLGMNMIDLVNDTDKSKVMENIYNRVNEKKKSLHYEFEGVNKKGNIINVEVFGTIMLYKDEQAIIGTVIDITDRKKSILRIQASEENLRLSNERFMLVAKATNDAIWDWNLETNMIEGNDRFYRLFDTKSGIPVPYELFISKIHPGDAPLILKNFETAIKNKENSLAEEFRLKSADGSYRIISDRSYILYHNNGEAYRMLGAMQDITNQKIAQQQLLIERDLSDTIINSLPGIFYLFNKEGKFYRWNKNLEIVTGYSAEEIRLLHPLDLFAVNEKELLTEKINNVFLSGEDNVEAHILGKTGELILYYFTGMVINYEDEACVMGIGFDLTEKVNSQQQLVESEEKFRTLIEQASDGIFISNQLGDYLEVNSSALSLTGYSREELLRLNMRDIVYEEDLKLNPINIQKLLSGQTILSERVFKRKNGSLVNVEISGKLLKDGRLQGIVRDITARKFSELGLRNSEEKRRLIMNAALDAIICIETNGKVTFWNPQAEKIFGWTAEEANGKILSNLIIPEKFKSIYEKLIAEYLKTGNGKVFNKVLELSAINRYKGEFLIELTVLPIKQGNEEFFCAFVRDITARKNAEEDIRISEHKYRLLFEQNPMPMWMISLPKKNFLAVNEAAVEFYGYSKEEFLKMNIKDIRPDDEKHNMNTVISTYKAGISNTGIWQHRKKDATIVMVNTITHDIIYEGKHAKLVLSNDMTEKIMAEEKLKNSHTDLRQLATHLQNIRESERTHMAREIHDELGQQLTGLKMDLSWINKKLNTSDHELKQKMNETLNLIDGTVRTVRRIATQLRPSILDDLGIVAAMEWQSEEFQKRSEIETHFTSNVFNITVSPELVTGFFRIFQESLTNVLRHAKATKVKAALNLQDGLLVLKIADNGIGFNSKEIESKKTLGLLGMKERTLIMGGSYEITSKPGKGTTVIIMAPLNNIK